MEQKFNRIHVRTGYVCAVPDIVVIRRGIVDIVRERVVKIFHSACVPLSALELDVRGVHASVYDKDVHVFSFGGGAVRSGDILINLFSFLILIVILLNSDWKYNYDFCFRYFLCYF